MKLSVIIPSLDGKVPVMPDDPRLEVVIVKGVCPVSAARNEGLRRATGDYVAWVDSDDEVTAEWLPAILGAIEDGPDVVNFDAYVRWVDSQRSAYQMKGPYSDGAVAPDRYRKDYFRGRVGGQLWGKVFRRTLFNGLSFEGSQYEELAVMYELLWRVRSVRHMAKALYVYNRRSTGLSQCVTGASDVVRIVDFAEGKPELRVGVCQIAADYIRHSAIRPKEVMAYVRSSLMWVLLATDVAWRIKVKCLLAALGR